MKPTKQPDYVRYEAEKKRLWMECSTTAEYEQKIRELAHECGI